MTQTDWISKALEFYTVSGSLKEGDVDELLSLVKKMAGSDGAMYLRKKPSASFLIQNILPWGDLHSRNLFPDKHSNLYNTGILFSTEAEGSLLGDLKPGAGIRSFVFIPEAGKQAALLLFWTSERSFDSEFRTFIDKITFRLDELAELREMRYRFENLKIRYDAILETVPQGVVFVEESNGKGWVNSKAAEMLSLVAGDISPLEISNSMAVLRSQAANQEDISGVSGELMRKADTTLRNWMWLYGTPVSKALCISCTPTLNGNVRGRLWMLEDVTEEYLKNEQLQELNRELDTKRKMSDAENTAKSEFLANMSHEIRTPMNGVIGMTSLLQNSPLNAEQMNFVDTIRMSGEALLTIINDILDFSKIESGKLELEEYPFSISTVIEETFDLLSTNANSKGLDLLYTIDTNVPPFVTGDITRLRQILVNLVSNGIKFTEKGEILVTVSTVKSDEEDHKLVFSVRDTGIGISTDKINRLFKAFSQADASTTRKYGGTGLGLAICTRLVSMMNGHIWVESELGKGTVFHFTIKAKIATHAPEVKISAFTDFLSGKKVLLVDDNQTNLSILTRQCESWGMKVVVASSGKEGIALVEEKNSFDLAILDMMMPEMDGIETATRIRAIQGDKKFPLVLLSSAAQSNREEKELFELVLNKPMRMGPLYKTLNAVVRPDNLPNEADHKIIPEEHIRLSETLPLKILVAEDNAINQRLAIKVLERLGYHADVVSDGVEVLEAFGRQFYELVLMDVQMPEMDGFEATAELKKLLGTRAPLIIAVTANAMVGEKEHCLSMGMDDYLAKPFRVEDVRNIIEKWRPRLQRQPGA
jgi:signal transduction histidine kinase/CheY-like chemotaxis protein